VGIHDTIADRNPRFTFESKWHDLLWRAKVRMAIAQATTILTVSQYSKRSIAEFFHVPVERIAVIQEAASPRFFRQEFPPAARPFVLYAGGISPNKNLARLLEAFAATRARTAGAQLILVGDYTSDGFKSNYAELRQLVQRLNLAEDAIFAGFVPDAELARLYNTCRMFAMPSLDEGFGLPAVEAMACGAPAIVSGGNSLEEVVGPGGLIVDPKQPGEIAAAIDRIFFDDGLHRTLAARAWERAKDFSWENSARQIMQVFERHTAA
jgi:glycosyltransferase involved in cell wall biosynthesis